MHNAAASQLATLACFASTPLSDKNTDVASPVIAQAIGCLNAPCPFAINKVISHD
ncbi:hypothetical protein EHW99_1601 [Erwinia amylovora]|uniref:Uncharacterized protein n=2 Tax=Erwinia amylovora TaxID=552 RepID=A0A831EQX5_ERWAM|nr:hypothetical protein EaACW_1995 [Erwinia amylovora ACW56400]QJQ54305.1 hypothetical protein EHX00_1601 [Erwinia amylovora]CBA20934.1 hypothetical protein predicted by Glimmer/Critica [Erwinia amylovora CFBP1430]CBJ46614.1 hypothetical protein EAM_1939 [Erwinia amylovora ATCC 49946]CCO78842.1 hypothetical protein BN432_2045 [Erwinia amylovora Ea356]CCO82640.1 hypothetical protein BN433_2070 [Erwinia amylovora Ea266]CCO86421.1 hypothetical protein BN434_2034 [Erwinia amylovora CFBP 2585]CCO